jgi:DnaJ-class molecular chaperone
MDDCSKCEGNGYIIKMGILFRCDKCGGRGELDWLEQVIGRRKDVKTPNMDQLIERYKSENKVMLRDWKKTI